VLAGEGALGGVDLAVGGDDVHGHEFGVAAVVVGFDGFDLDAEALEEGGGVDVVDFVAVDAAEVAALDGAGDGVGVEVDDFAPVGDAEGGDLLGAICWTRVPSLAPRSR
jgi:hypothetical protein